MEARKATISRVNDQVSRILASPQFRESPRLQSLFRFIVYLTLEGKADQIKESTIASEVFGRKDTTGDSIVRSAVGRLRARLEDYYERSGAEDPVHIVVPRGTYAPEIHERPAVFPQTIPPAVSQAEKSSRKVLWTTVVVAAAFLGLLLGAFMIWRDREQPERGTNAEARELYLQGRYYWSKRTPEDLNRAVDYFTQAVVKNPRYAQGYAGLADTYNLLSEYTVMPYQEAFKRAIAASKTAIQLDDKLPEAHNALAFASFYGAWDAVTAEREFRRALQLDPNYSTAHHWYATFLMSRGREREALLHIAQAQALEPSSRSILADKGCILLWAGQITAARTLLEQMVTTDSEFVSPHQYLAFVYLLERRYSDSLSEARKVASLTHNAAEMAIFEAGQNGLARKGVPGMLEQMLLTEENSAPGQGIRYLWVARMCALLGKKEDAIRLLQSALAQHETIMVSLTADPFFASMRNEAAFQELVKRVENGARADIVGSLK